MSPTREAPPAELSPAASSIFQKVGALKKALQFDVGIESRLHGARSCRDLLHFVRDAVLAKLTRLHEIGVMGQESYRVLEAFNEKCDVVLAEERAADSGEGQLDAEELYKEVRTLREQLGELKAKHVADGIISEREHALGEENAHLHGRLQAQRAQLRITGIQQKILTSARETVNNLRDRNSALRSRVEYQARLLQSLAAENPGHRETLSTMENLTEEHRRLKARFEGLSDLLGQFQSLLPADVRGAVQELAKKNAGAMAVFEGRGAQLEEVFAKTGEGSGPPFLESIERLNEENTRLKRILKTGPLIERFIEGEKAGGKGNPAPIIEALDAENQKLERALREREQQIRLLGGDASNKPLVKALQRLRDRNIELLKDNARNEQARKQLAAELKEYQRRLKDRHLLIRENQSLKTEMESCRQQMETLKRRGAECAALKKEYEETRSRYQTLAGQYRKVSEKLTMLAEEHDLLVSEYEKLFVH